MGGKSSKSKEPEKEKSNSKSKSISSNMPIISKKIAEEQSSNTGNKMDVETTDIQGNAPAYKSEEEMHNLFIRSLIETLANAESVSSLIREFDPSDFESYGKQAKQVYFVKEIHRLLNNPTQADQIIQDLESNLRNLLRNNPGSDEVNMLMLCVSTGIRLLRIPENQEAQKSVVEALVGLLQNSADDIEGTALQRPVTSLVEDIEALSGTNSAGQSLDDRITAARNHLQTMDASVLTVNTLEEFIGSIQSWIAGAPEDLESDENWSSILPFLRQSIKKTLEGKFFDLSCIQPHSSIIDKSMLMNCFRLGANLSFGTLNFTVSGFKWRAGNIYVQYYIEEKNAISRALNTVLSL